MMAFSTKRRRVFLLGLGLLLVVFALIQLRQPDRTNPPVVSDIAAPPEVAAILDRACYDCHSHETRWPWYSFVAPVSWWVAHHVEEGRGDLNFSDWPVFGFDEQADNLRAIDEQIAKGEMPLKSYLILHPEARLTAEEKDTLRRWAAESGG